MQNLIGNANETKFCKYCGERVLLEAVICTKCGRQIEELKAKESNIVINNNVSSNSVSNSNPTLNVNQGMHGDTKSKFVSIILCLLGFVGFAGLHKFYERKIFMGIIYFFTGGFFVIGTVIDLICLLGKPKQYYI